jgi:hypothetical protein
MRKLLHLVFAIWKTKKEFDKNYYPWDTPAHVERREQRGEGREGAAQEQAAGLTLDEPAKQEVTAAAPITSTVILPEAKPLDESTFLDFAHIKKQLPIARLLDHLGIAAKPRGPGAQKRCACPIHRADDRGRTFSVNLKENVFHCFDPVCQKKGDVIDLWAALHSQSSRQAALDLARTFDLEPARTEKRYG